MIELPTSLATSLATWIKDSNPKGDESDADDIKRVLSDFVDEHTLCRATIERKLREHLSSYNISFRRDRIRVSESSVTLVIDGKGRLGHITLDDSQFDSSEELSRLAGYAEELENSVWDGEEGEDLIEKWFDLED